MPEIAVMLHNVRSAYNVGSIFRTADAAGVSKIFLTGFTPAPVDRFGRLNKEIAKTALGAEKSIQWRYGANPRSLLTQMKKEGWVIAAVEQDARAVDYRRFKVDAPTLFIFGNEVRGLSKSLRHACDVLVEIPMHGAMVRQAHHPRHSKSGKESLNVSVTAGIILFSAVQ